MPDFRKCPDFPKCRSDKINAVSSSQKIHRAGESQSVSLFNLNRSGLSKNIKIYGSKLLNDQENLYNARHLAISLNRKLYF